MLLQSSRITRDAHMIHELFCDTRGSAIEEASWQSVSADGTEE
ncbi:MAG: hypothetical protein OJF47_001613 [Nitrospira sp.]|nr:MAG: hypothetical protein OJF47_001613 [Nitrospira sp.]